MRSDKKRPILPKEHPLAHPVFGQIAEIAAQEGVEVYVIGGFVRDHFLNRPCTDIDVVVVGSGIRIAELLAKKRNCSVNVFKSFGTAMLRAGDMEVEFVGARKESYRADSRKPIVEDGTVEEDQNRRDFTINALAFSLNAADFGTLVDPFNGMEDLHNGIIRTPLDPDTTFSDDPLRIIRGIRFATQLGFRIEEGTLEAMKRNRERVKILSRERIDTELEKILMSPIPSVGFYLLDECGLLPLIFPELEALKGVERRGRRAHKDNFAHTLQVLDNVAEKNDNLWLRWAALLHDIGKPRTKGWDEQVGWTFHGHEVVGSKMVKSIFYKMKLPMNQKMKYVQKLVTLHLRPIALAKEGVTDSAVRRLLFEAGDDIEELMLLCEADITSANDAKVRLYLKNFALVREKLKEIEEKDRIRNFQPPITGEIIMQTYGIEPCREVGEIKQVIKDAILEGKIGNNYEEAFALMEETAKTILKR